MPVPLSVFDYLLFTPAGQVAARDELELPAADAFGVKTLVAIGVSPGSISAHAAQKKTPMTTGTQWTRWWVILSSLGCSQITLNRGNGPAIVQVLNDVLR